MGTNWTFLVIVTGSFLLTGVSGTIAQDLKAPNPTQPPAGTLQPTSAKPTYPKEINGKDLNWYLKEAQYRYQPDPQMREIAIRTIPAFGPDARKAALPILIDIISSERDPSVRIDAISIVTIMGPDMREEVKAKGVIRALITLLQNTGPSSAVRIHCVRALSTFGPDAVSAVDVLRNVASDPSWETRMAVAEALGSVGQPPPPKKVGDLPDPNMKAAKTLLTYMLRNDETCVAVRLEAVKALLTIGPPKAASPIEYQKEVKEFLDPLAERLKHEESKNGDRGVYLWLLLLQIMYDDRVMVENVKKIAKFIEAPENPMHRLYALQALSIVAPKFGEMRLLKPPTYPTAGGPVVDSTISAIIAALNYPEPELQVAAMTTLAHIGKEAIAAEKALKALQAKPPKIPLDAPKDFKPDDTIQKMAAETIEYVTGRKKFSQPAPEKKDGK
jgi:HEAT repeat protein